MGVTFTCATTTRNSTGRRRGSPRAAFYLLIFPTGFFLAQVFTEGLFIGLAFCSLVLMRHKRLFWAALLAALAVWTRAVGVALLIPLALAWAYEVNWKQLNWRSFARGLLVLIPAKHNNAAASR